MPRFFFNLDGGTFVRDPDGEELPDGESALAYAERLARELAKKTWETHWVILVTDEQHHVVHRVVLRRAEDGIH